MTRQTGKAPGSLASFIFHTEGNIRGHRNGIPTSLVLFTLPYVTLASLFILRLPGYHCVLLLLVARGINPSDFVICYHWIVCNHGLLID